MNEKIKKIQTRYIEKLSGTNCNSLQGALKIIENCKQKVAIGEETDKNGVPFFEFSEEWISKKSIDINDNSIVRKIRKVEDVTTILEKYQVFTDIKRTGEATEILGAKTPEESKKKFFDSLKNKRLKYINGCYAINVDPKYEIENKIEFNEK